jgi:hypothetical protein
VLLLVETASKYNGFHDRFLALFVGIFAYLARAWATCIDSVVGPYGKSALFSWSDRDIVETLELRHDDRNRNCAHAALG